MNEKVEMDAQLVKYCELYDFTSVGIFNRDYVGIINTVNITDKYKNPLFIRSFWIKPRERERERELKTLNYHYEYRHQVISQ